MKQNLPIFKKQRSTHLSGIGLLALSLLFVFSGMIRITPDLQAQTVVKEATYTPKGKARITNLTEVQVDKENNEMKLFYLTKSTGKKIKAEVLYFDLDFNFLREEMMEEELDKIREKFGLSLSLNFCPESRAPLLTVEPNLSGQVVFKKGYIDRYYNWNTGLCDDRFKVEDKVKPRGDDGERIKLVNYWTNNDIQTYVRSVSAVAYSYRQAQRTAQTMSAMYGRQRDLMSAEGGDVVFLGLVFDKTIAGRPNNGKSYVFQKFSVDKLEKVKEVPLNFDVPAVPIYFKILENGRIAYIFYRSDKKYEYIEAEFDGDIARRMMVDAPSDNTWIIDDISLFGDQVLISGLLGKQTFNSGVMAVLIGSVPTVKTTIRSYAAKPVGYQLMLIGEDKIKYVKQTSLDAFKNTFVVIGGEKKGKPFTGGGIRIGEVFMTKDGNIIITGQKLSKKNEMLEVVAFYFDRNGNLVANYASKLRDKNDYNKYTSTKHALMNAPQGGEVYWTVFEVAGAKKTGASARILYYPRIAKISADGRSVSTFMELGNRKYFLDDKFPVNYVDDQHFIFLGSSRKGGQMWFTKVKF